MQRDDLPEDAPGRYVPYGRVSYYHPDDLPPDLDLDFGSEFQDTLQETIYLLGRLNGIGAESSVSPAQN